MITNTVIHEPSEWEEWDSTSIHSTFGFERDQKKISLLIYTMKIFTNDPQTKNIPTFRCNFSREYKELFSKIINNINLPNSINTNSIIEIEKILRICDSISPLSEELVETVVKCINVKEYKIRNVTFEIFTKFEANYKSIPTFLLCMKQWNIENKIKVPKVLQMKILCNITDKELDPITLKDYIKKINNKRDTALSLNDNF